MFISTYENKLDKKGRVSVPAAYRSHLSNLGYNSVICYPSFTNSSIEFCPQSRLEKIAETIGFEQKNDYSFAEKRNGSTKGRREISTYSDCPYPMSQ